jgi:hypothetical protein
MGFGLVIRFIWLLSPVTTSNYNRFSNSHTLHFTTAYTNSSQSAVFTALLGNDFQRRSFLSFHVHVLTGRRLSRNQLGVATQRLTTIGAPPSPTPSPWTTICDDLRTVCLPTAKCMLMALDWLVSRSHSYFTTGDLPPISSSWGQAPCPVCPRDIASGQTQ